MYNKTYFANFVKFSCIYFIIKQGIEQETKRRNVNVKYKNYSWKNAQKSSSNARTKEPLISIAS